MRKLLVGFGIVLITIAARTEDAKAGSLNSYENEVISAAKLIYEYNGVEYKVDQVFINQLSEYLSSDGIDLTAEQRDEVMQLAFSNIEKGVTDGYLIPVEGEDTKASPEDGSENASEEGSDMDSSTASDNGKDASSNDAGGADNDEKNSSKDSPSAMEDNSSDASGNNQPTNTDIRSNSEDVTPEGMIDQIINSEQEDPAKGDTSINVEAGTSDNVDQNIIKNTGIDLTNTVLTCIAMGVLMIISFYVTIRFNLFAHNDE